MTIIEETENNPLMGPGPWRPAMHRSRLDDLYPTASEAMVAAMLHWPEKAVLCGAIDTSTGVAHSIDTDIAKDFMSGAFDEDEE